MTQDASHRFLDARLNFERREMPNDQILRLDRMRLLLDCLDNPQRRYRVVHVAGTKGKGSTAHLIAAMLERLGGKVGLHTSPHFHRLEERFRINQRMIEAESLAQLVNAIREPVSAVDAQLARSQVELTYFEITTALALWHFARERVEWAVIEVGMGGRLDATNVVDPEVCVITSISRDHTRWLGTTLESIAREKAGIIKPNRPVVSGVATGPAQDVIEAACRQTSSPFRQLGRDFNYAYTARSWHGSLISVRTWKRVWPTAEVPLLGEHQAANVAVAIATLETLFEPNRPVALAQLVDSLASVRLTGRIEVFPGEPFIVLDVAHNDASAAALARVLFDVFGPRAADSAPRVLLFGVSRDKDWPTMLEHLCPLFDHIVLSQYRDNPRGLPPDEMAGWLRQRGAATSLTETPRQAWNQALNIVRQSRGTFSRGRDSAATAKVPINPAPNAPFGVGVASGNAPFGQEPCNCPLICIAGSFFLAAELEPFVRQWREVDSRRFGRLGSTDDRLDPVLDAPGIA
jgi:dihydrofolate synthase/folylpolyglutamate synthase